MKLDLEKQTFFGNCSSAFSFGSISGMLFHPCKWCSYCVHGFSQSKVQTKRIIFEKNHWVFEKLIRRPIILWCRRVVYKKKQFVELNHRSSKKLFDCESYKIYRKVSRKFLERVKSENTGLLSGKITLQKSHRNFIFLAKLLTFSLFLQVCTYVAGFIYICKGLARNICVCKELQEMLLLHEPYKVGFNGHLG